MFVVEVEDTGIGMDEKHRADLFQPFQQADASTTRRFGGTGLGLTISKALAEMLGGGIEVDSEVDRGSTFRIRIAAGEVVHAAARSALAQEADLAASGEPRLRERVLLAEDGRDNQVLISRVLRKAGASVEIVGDGAQAIEAAWSAHAAGAPFGLILMDMHMPEVDGRAATRELRARGYRGPIIALTASAMKEDRTACFEAGCDELASKPLRTQELLALCRRFLEPVSAA
jgi:CheY-like chemotaxis protein